MSITRMELSETSTGMVLARPVKVGGQAILLHKDVALNDRHLDLLRSRGVTHVFVHCEHGDSVILTDDPERLAQVHERELRRFGGLAGSTLQQALLDATVAAKLEEPPPSDALPDPVELADGDVPDRQTLQEMARTVQKLPTLSTVYQDVERVTRNPAASAADVARVISGDPVIASALLKVANSALYSQAEPVATVTRAVSMLGLREVRDLCLATSVLKVVRACGVDEESLATFWNHALGVGAAARVIAEERGIRQPEEHFLAGLLHDLGELFWLGRYPRAVAAVHARAAREGLTVHECEQGIMGMSHTRLGRLVARHWHLPPQYVEAIEKHHDPASAEHWPAMTATVHLADLICVALELDGPGLCRVPILCRQAWTTLGFEFEDLAHLLRMARAEYRHAQQALPLEAGVAVTN